MTYLCHEMEIDGQFSADIWYGIMYTAVVGFKDVPKKGSATPSPSGTRVVKGVGTTNMQTCDGKKDVRWSLSPW